MEAWQTGKDFKDLLSANPAVTAVLGAEKIEALFDLRRSIRNVDTIFARVGLGA
jgi:adenylosuccinate lyase